MTALALISRWLLAGGWKLALLFAFAIAAGLMVVRINHWRSEAARVPALLAQIAQSEKRADVVLAKLADAEQKRGAAEAALSAWQSYKSVTLTPLKDEGRHAPASTNSVCLPSALDRRLRNDAIGKLLGPDTAGDADGVPAAARAPR